MLSISKVDKTLYISICIHVQVVVSPTSTCEDPYIDDEYFFRSIDEVMDCGP